MPRRLIVTLAAVATSLGLLSACDQAKALGDKASVCADALGLATLVPDTDPEKVRKEAVDKANRLKSLAKSADDKDVKGALTTLADEYVATSKRRAEDLRNFAGWAGDLYRNQDNLRKICL
ncbi:hypothetical protein [Actinocrispum wychmicini]|uniref:Uncharacterized protein n=1 Tax=Actinocrispum wychmicini TaxID=1213861 RepID=A0A4V2S406_9PSEU|nr:hypothetical protein [Actinocrispum wychmicini]TCO46470.1 hypothetical protein EV192_11949 [Actinocrispum wychmicini]